MVWSRLQHIRHGSLLERWVMRAAMHGSCARREALPAILATGHIGSRASALLDTPPLGIFQTLCFFSLNRLEVVLLECVCHTHTHMTIHNNTVAIPSELSPLRRSAVIGLVSDASDWAAGYCNWIRGGDKLAARKTAKVSLASLPLTPAALSHNFHRCWKS